MSVCDDSGPAFPHEMETRYKSMNPGMSLRDYFAAKALPAIINTYAEVHGRCIGTDHTHYNCAAHAYRMADAMLKARNEKEQE